MACTCFSDMTQACVVVSVVNLVDDCHPVFWSSTLMPARLLSSGCSTWWGTEGPGRMVVCHNTCEEHTTIVKIV